MSPYERASDIKHGRDQASVCTAAGGRAKTERTRSRPAVRVIVTTSTATAGKVPQRRSVRPGPWESKPSAEKPGERRSAQENLGAVGRGVQGLQRQPFHGRTDRGAWACSITQHCPTHPAGSGAEKPAQATCATSRLLSELTFRFGANSVTASLFS